MRGKLLSLLARNRAITDILTAKAAVPVNIRHQRVGAFLRFGHGMAQRGCAQHASAVGKDAIVLSQLRTRMEHLRTVNLFQRQAVDFISGVVIARIAASSNHHAQRRTLVPL
jgi:hypothetical protein